MKKSEFYPNESPLFAAAVEQLKGKPVAVCGHLRPDGDCIGSIVAVVRVLRSLGIDAIGINRDEVPATLKAFVADTPLMLALDFELNCHVAVTVDCADKKRIGDRLI